MIDELLDEAWTAITDGEDPPVEPSPVEIIGTRGHLVSHFAAEDIAVSCVVAALRAACALDRGGRRSLITIDRAHVAAACRSERYFAVDGQPSGLGFAPLSRFWRAADGWVRTHANYPWHREALLGVLGSPPDADGVASTIASLRAEDVETLVFATGGIAAAVRTFDSWQQHPQGRALAAEPLVAHDVLGSAPARVGRSAFRVLDLTRVIAGPVCTRFLAALGADVLRVDPPHRPDMAPGALADTLLGKRSCVVDFRRPEGLDRLHALLDGTDVLVCGYRPGALEAFGLSPQAVADRHPGVVVVYIDAWGHHGPWSGRRGFDSIVQAPTGIAAGESTDGGEPGALPCQLLDHGTGYLAAAAALDGMRRQRDQGGTHIRRLSLARTAWWVTSGGAPHSVVEVTADTPQRYFVELPANGHSLVAVLPPGAIGGEALRWSHAGSGYGNEAPDW